MRRPPSTATRLGAWGLVLLAAACSHEHGNAPPHARPEARAGQPAIATVPVGPISFFQQACARCHGAYGAMYEDGLGARRTDDELARLVRDMVTGPAQASLDDQSLRALVAYHRSLADGRPFLALTRADGAVLEGEVTPGSSVTVRTGSASVAAVVQGHSWRATPDTTTPRPSEVEARIGDRVTRLPLGPAPCSHSAPGR